MNSLIDLPSPSRTASWLTHAASLATLLALAACGGGGGGDSAPAAAPRAHALASIEIEPAGTRCANGGSLINTGIDSNNNGLLDTAEITSSAYVCNGTPGANGAPGTPGVSTLLQVLNEPAGTHCANGGSRIIAGRDVDGNGVLDSAEVTVTSFVCGGAPGANGADGTNGTNGTDGTNGTNGTDGTNGLNSLMNVTTETAGANCTTGGVLIASGLDSNGDNVLQPGEVTRNQYVCNGTQGATGATGAPGAPGAAGLSVLIATAAEPAGANCLHGGTRITSGQDTDRDDVLDAGEVTATSYVCNGPGITWVNVASSSVQASSNTGYIVQTATRATVTLPTSPTVGDLVRVSGMGSGGWQISQNAGQSIVTRGIASAYATTPAGVTWTARESNRNWMAVASSADGNKLAAVDAGGQIYTSVDAGINWTARESNRNWRGIASSSDGTKLFAVETWGRIYTSTDSGANWDANGPTRPWIAVASSANGNNLVAAANGGQLYTSNDSGVSWTPRESTRDWFAVAASADGSMMVAVAYNDQIYTSTDFGVNWTPRESVRNWTGIASSADGNKLVATDQGGRIYTSSDAGVTWVPRAITAGWISVASSSDGTRLVAAEGSTSLYTSTDSGITWTAQATDTNRSWEAVASSADGLKLVAAVMSGGQLYTSTGATTTQGTTGWLRGEQYDAIELQYVGNGVFMPLSYTNGSGTGITGY